MFGVRGMYRGLIFVKRDIALKSCHFFRSSVCAIPQSSSAVNQLSSRYISNSNSQASSNNATQDSHQGNQEQPKNFKKSTVVLAVGAVVLGVAVYMTKRSSYRDGSSATNVQKSDENQPWVSYLAMKKPEIVELPKQVPYLIVGAGTAAFAAYRAIRAADAKAKVLLVSDDYYLPYMRPPLSKELWYSDNRELLKQLKFKQWNGQERSLFYEKEGFFCKPMELQDRENGGVAVALGQKVCRLDVKERKAFLENGKSVEYGKCLIATGGKPKNLPVIEKAGPDVLARCTLFRNVNDFWKLQKVTHEAKSVAIIGGGFLGSELACCLGKKGKETGIKVVQTFPEKGNMGQVLPEYLSKWATEKVKQEGVEIIPDTLVTACKFDRSARQVVLELSNGNSLSVDHVVVAVGLEPNTDLAVASGLETDPQRGGFLVNAELEARSNVWVAGDAACFYDTQLGRRRVEHHDHAVVSGRLAGENMTGAGRPYWHQSMFWSDLGPDVGYEAIGIVDSSLPTVGVFAKASHEDTPRAVVEASNENLRSETEKDVILSSLEGDDQQLQPVSAKQEDYGKGVVFYLRDKVIVGVVMWNVFNRMAIARQLIRDAKTYDDLSEVAKLFNLYGEPVGENVTATDSENTSQ